MARWSREGRAAYEAEGQALLHGFFLFMIGARCSNQAENYYMKETFFFLVFSVSCSLFLRGSCAVPCFLFSPAVHTTSMSKEEKDHLTSGMYVRAACERA